MEWTDGMNDDGAVTLPQQNNNGETSGVDRSVAEELVEQARADGVDLVGPNGLLQDLTKHNS